MIRQTIIPTSNTYTLQLQIPDSMIGKKVAVFCEEEKNIADAQKKTLFQQETINALQIEQLFAKKVINFNNIDDFYKNINLNFSNHKFDRDEANER